MKNLNKLLINKTLKKLKHRDFVITPFHVGRSISMHNGKNFEKIFINSKMVGYKFGTFRKTRKTFKFKKN